MSYISAIEIALPDYCHKHIDITNYFIERASEENTKRKLKFVSDKSGISRRYSVINDFSETENKFTLFEPHAKIASIENRMSLYRLEAIKLAKKAVRNIYGFEELKSTFTHIITVTCTGLFAPGLDIELMKKLDLPSDIGRSSVNFMGCNAAILALKQAKSICDSQENANVLVVCVELCTIHFQHNNDDDNILSNTLFGDGAAATVVSSKKNQNNHYKSLKIKSFNSLIIHKGFKDMAWQLSSTGFLMNLTSYVSELINGNMAEFLKNANIDVDSIKYWAIHPGGKKILDDFSATVNIEKKQLQASYDVLNDYGNMSSPTILFVLKKLLDSNSSIKPMENIFVAAFGPGISLETMQLENV